MVFLFFCVLSGLVCSTVLGAGVVSFSRVLLECIWCIVSAGLVLV